MTTLFIPNQGDTYVNPVKRRFVIAGFISLALLGTACGSDSKSESTTPAPAATSADASSTSAASADATTTVAEAPTTDAPADLSGDIAIDGSSTVAPLMKLTAESFQDANSGVTVAVGTSGTGGGFEKFCAGETDISDASRPIKDTEVEACKAKGIDYYEVLVANDALTVVVNPENDWAKCLTVAQLKVMWEPEAEGKITNWNQIDPSFPDQALTLFGAGTDSGTFDYFTEVINGKAKASRTDYNPTEDDNVTVTGVAGDKGALGYFGFSYLETNQDKVKGVEVDGGGGCVAPSAATVLDKTYTPMSRPLLIYVKKTSAERPEVKAYVNYYVANQDSLAEEGLFVGLSDSQKTDQATELAEVLQG